jgi:hypothetical protein
MPGDTHLAVAPALMIAEDDRIPEREGKLKVLLAYGADVFLKEGVWGWCSMFAGALYAPPPPSHGHDG